MAGLPGDADANTEVAGLWDMAADGAGLTVDPEDPYGAGVAPINGKGVREGDDKGRVDSVEPCGDGEIANGNGVVLSVPTEKPGHRPQYNWQYVLQASKVLVICTAACCLLLDILQLERTCMRAPHQEIF